jgi:DNA invertase Pin-like site-specific DNA recombinase
MNETTKVSSIHLERRAFIYVRQSTTSQVEHNRESTERQYGLRDRAVALGWRQDQVSIIDKDLGITGSGLAERSGFAQMTAEVALGRAGIVLGLEVSRLARNNADWYRLLDLCGATDTLIGEGDGIYHPGLFNDRLVLGLKGTMSEAELHVLRARLNGGIRNKAERGELRRGLPVGLVFGEADGEVLLDPDEAVRGAIQTVFDRFAEVGSARRVWLHFRSEGLLFPSRQHVRASIQWIAPTYTNMHAVLTNPVYAGAYIYGRSKSERFVDERGDVRKRIRKRAKSQWPVFIRDHHKGFIDWATFEANQKRIQSNTHPTPHQPGGAVREGAALLQAIAHCARCSRKLCVSYSGKFSTPAYHCPGNNIANGRGEYCLRFGGKQIARFVDHTPPGYVAMLEATLALGVSRQTILQRVSAASSTPFTSSRDAEKSYESSFPTLHPGSLNASHQTEVQYEK